MHVKMVRTQNGQKQNELYNYIYIQITSNSSQVWLRQYIIVLFPNKLNGAFKRHELSSKKLEAGDTYDSVCLVAS